MTTKLVEWPSKRGPITKIMPRDGCKGNKTSLAVEKWYDFHEFGCHLGNVGLTICGMIRVIVCYRRDFPRGGAVGRTRREREIGNVS